MTELVPILIFIVISILFVFANLMLSRFIAPRNPGKVKNSTYECGEESVGPAWAKYGMRFQNYALAFIIFDIELALIFPVARIFRESVRSGSDLPVLGSLLAFLLILFLGLLYLWRAGDLSWNAFDGEGRK